MLQKYGIHLADKKEQVFPARRVKPVVVGVESKSLVWNSSIPHTNSARMGKLEKSLVDPLQPIFDLRYITPLFRERFLVGYIDLRRLPVVEPFFQFPP